MARRAARPVLVALALTAGVAHAGPNDVVALPAAAPSPTVPDPGIDALLPHLDQLVADAIQDSGLTLALESRGPREALSDIALLKRAQDSWVVLPTL
jgi:hypothetical protein